MKILLVLPLLVALAGCSQTLGNLTPGQDAALACLGTTAGAAIAASLKPNSAAAVTANGTVLCTTATGVAAVLSAK